MRMLAQFLREHREDIMREWERRTLEIESSRGLSRAGRRDHIPQLLDTMAEAIDRLDASDVCLEGVPQQHAEQRWSQDYELREIVMEYGLLRQVVLDLYRARAADLSDADRTRIVMLSTMSENIDLAITEAVDHYQRQRDRTRDYFVGMLTHDLRDPLNVIALNADILQLQDAVPAANAASLARIISNAARMRRLINDMLDVTRSRLGSGMPITPTSIQLRPVVDQAVAEVEGSFPDRQVLVDIPLTCTGVWDPLRIGQVVSNLVANAFKHGRGPVKIRARAEDQDVLLDVESLGEVAHEVRERMFEPFAAGAGSTGTGLGLYIVAEIARAHGGELSLVPDTHGSAVFRVRLPINPPGADAVGRVG